MQVTQHELKGNAEFLGDSSFRLNECPFPEKASDIPLGLYELPRRTGDAHLYRLNHPLADAVLSQAKDRPMPIAEIQFDYGAYEGKVTILEPMVKQSGWLTLSILTVEALDQAEDYLLFTGVTESGSVLDDEQSRRLLLLPGRVSEQPPLHDPPTSVAEQLNLAQKTVLNNISTRNAQFFEAELKKLDGWADDQIASTEKTLRDVKKRVRELRNEASKIADLAEQARLQDQISELERSKRKLRQEIFEAEDRILAQRDGLVSIIRGKLEQKTTTKPLFSLRWSLS